ncbi:hypothetical protein AJ79_09034 [Helicocarpus griseus UAMH5409]|uniref:Zn(2)-C6 fungal-type domain-containing protein n=1 Tax=Helicocarpus griseus UAMH5409 TaxID=1447875 RepID=A0A2B7WN40_9EURO|nr:hypothetical protein AJ79_09034 [Helicocarpus griseus UAMH5409]
MASPGNFPEQEFDGENHDLQDYGPNNFNINDFLDDSVLDGDNETQQPAPESRTFNDGYGNHGVQASELEAQPEAKLEPRAEQQNALPAVQAAPVPSLSAPSRKRPAEDNAESAVPKKRRTKDSNDAAEFYNKKIEDQLLAAYRKQRQKEIKQAGDPKKKDRLRISDACNRCKWRKLKCDGNRTQCCPCREAGQGCYHVDTSVPSKPKSYKRRDRQRESQRADDAEWNARHVEEYEERLIAYGDPYVVQQRNERLRELERRRNERKKIEELEDERDREHERQVEEEKRLAEERRAKESIKKKEEDQTHSQPQEQYQPHDHQQNPYTNRPETSGLVKKEEDDPHRSQLLGHIQTQLQPNPYTDDPNHPGISGGPFPSTPARYPGSLPQPDHFFDDNGYVPPRSMQVRTPPWQPRSRPRHPEQQPPRRARGQRLGGGQSQGEGQSRGGQSRGRRPQAAGRNQRGTAHALQRGQTIMTPPSRPMGTMQHPQHPQPPNISPLGLSHPEVDHLYSNHVYYLAPQQQQPQPQLQPQPPRQQIGGQQVWQQHLGQQQLDEQQQLGQQTLEQQQLDQQRLGQYRLGQQRSYNPPSNTVPPPMSEQLQNYIPYEVADEEADDNSDGGCRVTDSQPFDDNRIPGDPRNAP